MLLHYLVNRKSKTIANYARNMLQNIERKFVNSSE